MIEPIRVTVEVACNPEHAFRTWTTRASAWWPPEHTATHERDAEIVFEPRVGGRIFERTTAGQEIEWGQVTEWDPPRRLRYQWHIAADPADATYVEIVFREEKQHRAAIIGRSGRFGGETWVGAATDCPQ